MLYPDHPTLALLVRERQMTLRQEARRVAPAVLRKERPIQARARRIRLAAAGAIAALATAIIAAAVAGDATPSLPLQTPSAATATLPGDSPVPFWPYETGARIGTSETYVDVRSDGSYFDAGIGRRVSVAAGG